MTKIIGLTGGIGSGKTTVAKLFEKEGIPVYISDEESKKIMALKETIQIITKHFGIEVLKESTIDRKKLANIVFNNPEKLKELNQIIHPLVAKHFKSWLKTQKHKFIIKESAILFESGIYKECDKIITVIASKEERIKRVVERDNVTKEEVIHRMNNQWSDQDRIIKSDYVIDNDNLEMLTQKVREINKKLILHFYG